jgi:hypothetical protein
MMTCAAGRRSEMGTDIRCECCGAWTCQCIGKEIADLRARLEKAEKLIRDMAYGYCDEHGPFEAAENDEIDETCPMCRLLRAAEEMAALRGGKEGEG